MITEPATHSVLDHLPRPLRDALRVSRMWPGGLAAAVAFLWSVACFLPVHTPLGLIFPARGGDPSWIAVMGESHRLGLVFGRDIAFNLGPLAGLATHYFQAETFPVVCALSFLVIGFYAAALAVFSLGARTPVPAIVVGLVGLYASELSLLALPIVTLFVRMSSERPIIMRPLCWLGCALGAALTLTKFTFFPLAAGVAVLADLLDLRDRRVPLHLLAYGVALTMLFRSVQPDLGPLLSFMTTSFEMTAGHSESMSVHGPWWEIAAFVLAAVVAGTAVWSNEREAVRRHHDRRSSTAALLAVLGGFVFIVFKAGFVRHDVGHTLLAWLGLALAAALYAAARWRADRDTRGLAVLLAIALVCTLLIVPTLLKVRIDRDVHDQLVRAGVQRIPREIEVLARFAGDPAGWIRVRSAYKQEAFKAIRQAEPLPSLNGTVDVIPSIQSVVLAHGLAYRPRPTILEYLAVRTPLIDANRRFFRGPRAPDYILFAPEGLDDRHPASADGPLWPDFLRHYEPTETWGPLLVLRRRPAAIPDRLGPPSRTTVAFGDPVPLDQAGVAVFLSADLHVNLLGRVVNAVFKLPRVFLTVSYSNGPPESYRLIPAIAREGLFISPLIDSSAGYLFLETGAPDIGSKLRWARSITLQTGMVGRWLYKAPIALKLFPLAGPPARPEPRRDPS